MEDMAATDGVAGDHGDDRFGNTAHQDLQIEHVEAPDPLLAHLVVTDVPVVAADRLVAPGAEGVGTLAAEDDDPDLRIVAGPGEGIGQLEECLRPEGVATLGTADGQLGHAFGHLVADVGERSLFFPFGCRKRPEVVKGIMGTAGDHGLHGVLRYCECLNSLHSTCQGERASSMPCAPHGTPVTPPLRSTHDCPSPPAGRSSKPCAPPGSWDPTASSIAWTTGSGSRRATRWWWPRGVPRVGPEAGG